MKQHTASSSHHFSTESILEQAWDDIVMLNNAVEAWPTGNGSYEPEYLMMLVTAQMDRGQTALLLLDTMDITEHHEEIKELKELYEKGNELFLEILEKDSDNIEIIYQETQGLGLRLTALEELLAKVCRIVEDGILFNSADWLQDDLDSAGVEFLQIFTDMARMIHGAPPELISIPSFKTWCSKFDKLEKKFKTKFSYFYSLTDALQQLQQRENNQQEFWWLHTNPGEEPDIEQIVSEEQLKELGSFFLPQAITQIESSCPDQELVIAYALDDAIGEQNRQMVKEHVKDCKVCLMTLLDIRAADAEASQILERLQDKAVSKDKQEVSADEWAAMLEKIPAWRLLPEQRDEIAIEFPTDIPELHSKETLPAFAAAAMAARPTTASLPLMQDSNEHPVTFAKVVTVAEEEMTSLYFILLRTDRFLFEEGKLHIIGRLEDFTPKTGTIYHCDWIDSDGNISLPEEFQVTDTGFTAVFGFQGLQEKPAGDLRILIIQQQ